MAFSIPYSRMTLNAGSSLPVAYWRKYDTESTSETSQDRLILTPAATRSGVKSWEWWFIASLLIPLGSPLASRTFTTCDLHNTSLDVGGGIGWTFGNLVSPFYIIVRPNGSQYNVLFTHEPNAPSNEFLLVSNATRGQLYTFTFHVIFGRLDQQIGLAGPGVPGGGVAGHPNNGYGRTRAWVNASNTPIDTGNVNNLQRAAHPSDGKTYTQTAMIGPWDGYYTYGGASLGSTYSLEVAATRVGRSFGEAAADGTNGFVLREDTLAAGSASVTSLTALSSDAIALPSSLTGGSPPPEEPPPAPTSNYGRWTTAVQWNAAPAPSDPPPDNPPLVFEGTRQWTPTVGWNASEPESGGGDPPPEPSPTPTPAPQYPGLRSLRRFRRFRIF